MLFLIQRLGRFLRKLARLVRLADTFDVNTERSLLTLGKMLTANISTRRDVRKLEEVEFQIFSQWGDDGIIQWLIQNIEPCNKTFVEFGVENYRESNTRFLLMNNNWSGAVIDGSIRNIQEVRQSEYYWKYDLTAINAFIDRDNINALLREAGFERELGLLHIDLDGNDYWIWEAIEEVAPTIVILEYNSVFGIDRAITVPYNKAFTRTQAHYSNQYAGASLKALHLLSTRKGYAFVGCNSAGNNAYFVRREAINQQVREISLQDGYAVSKFRDSRDRNGRLTYQCGDARLDLIRGLPVINVETNETETL
jgi:hypothetical protein